MSLSKEDFIAAHTINPFESIAVEDWEQYCGQFVAVARDGSGIVDNDPDYHTLVSRMRNNHPNVPCRVVPVSDLSQLTQETYQELIALVDEM